jgi:hypothetical protein
VPSFDALQVVEPLQFTFVPYMDLTGTVPEPSEAQLGKFFADMIEVSKTAAEAVQGLDASSSPDQMLAAIAKLPDGGVAGMMSRMNRPYADLCSGFPSEEQLGKLPPRVRLAFFAWLSGELNPEASGAVSSPAPQSAS